MVASCQPFPKPGEAQTPPWGSQQQGPTLSFLASSVSHRLTPLGA